MKKISSILLVIAMLVVSLIPMLAIGVSAAADGDVIASASSTLNLYYYSSDSAALAAGMIAKLDWNNQTVYVSNLDSACAYGGSGQNASKTITMIVPTYTVTDQDGTANSTADWNYGGRTFTIDGNGCVITAPFRIRIASNGTTNVLTLKNMTINSAATNGALQIQKNSRITLENATIRNNDGVVAGVGTIISQANSVLTLNSGAKILNSCAADKVTGNAVNAGVRLNEAGAQVVVNEGAEINTSGTAINFIAATTATVNGGKLYSKYGPVMVSGVVANINIKGGELISDHEKYASGSSYYAIHNLNAGSTVSITGGTITSNKNGGVYSVSPMTLSDCTINAKSRAINATNTTTIKNVTASSNTDRTLYASGASAKVTVESGNFYSKGLTTAQADNNGILTINGGTFWSDKTINALIIAGSGSLPGGVVTVNGGNFYCTAGADAIVFRKNESKADDAGVTTHDIIVNKYDSIVGCTNIYVEGPSGKDTKLIAAPDMVDGASVRTVKEEAGIRFQSKLNKSVVDNLTANATNVEFGTIIAPLDYLDDTDGVFTPEALTAAGRKYLKIKAANGINVDGEGNYVINAAMVKIKQNNIARDFVAIAYLTYTMGGRSYTVYGSYDPDNARSILEVANRTLADVVADGDVLVADDPETEDVNEQVVVDAAWREANGYVNAVTAWHVFDEATQTWKHVEGTGKYSKYDPDQLDVVKTYVPY